jgi:hypothetical protein
MKVLTSVAFVVVAAGYSSGELIENGKISIRLGPVRDVKDWLNNYQAFEKSPVVSIDAIGVRLEGNELQIDCGLDDYAA